MPRQMALRLPSLPAGTDQLRLRTNLEVYWDRLAVAPVEACPDAECHALPLVSARLEWHGFPERTDGAQRLPGYVFDHRRPLSDYRIPRGNYTEFGLVAELVAARDDAVAIFGPGEGILFEFAAAPRPPRPGWRRIYVFEADGWCKDMDRYTRNGETIDPIPSSTMEGGKRQALHQIFNTRYGSGLQ
jgi:hypothetical protein